ncbi:MAG TPA: hypothetical protein VNY84_15760 [Acidimicrobiales bacterium]|nr:hypothetical protein [Acidimicrobiales bacterium]
MLGAIFVFIVLVSVAVGGGLIVLRRHNRISPRVRTSAPLTWLLHPAGPARAHRRLRRAVRATRGAVDQAGASGLPVDGLLDCVDELERLAITADEQLVVAARFSGSVRRTMLRGLRPQINGLESVAARTAATVVSRTQLTDERLADAVARIHERLDALDAAHAEVAELEKTLRR